jgi:predicted phosphodiesterase
MTYAVISDIHGNYQAFQAVLSDAEGRGAERFLLLGDFIRDFPFPNEVLDAVRALPNCVAVAGNGDRSLVELAQADPADSVFHNRALFWNLRELTVENLAFLSALPPEVTVDLSERKTAQLMHMIPLYDYTSREETYKFSRADKLNEMDIVANAHAGEVAQYRADVVLFGHNHLQCYVEVAGKILLNPGSCGLSYDEDSRAAYAIMNVDGGKISCELLRIDYDIAEMSRLTCNSGLYKIAPDICEMNIASAETGNDVMMGFIEFLRNFPGGGEYPTPKPIWEKAYNSFDLERFKRRLSRRS